MLSQEEFDRIVKQGGCVFEVRGKVCKKTITPGGKYCPQHQAMLDALGARTAGTSPISIRRKR